MIVKENKKNEDVALKMMKTSKEQKIEYLKIKNRCFTRNNIKIVPFPNLTGHLPKNCLKNKLDGQTCAIIDLATNSKVYAHVALSLHELFMMLNDKIIYWAHFCWFLLYPSRYCMLIGLSDY